MLVYLKLLRVHQWVKNFFLFAAAFFGGVLLFDGMLQKLSLGFLCFCGISSAVYILNDLCDAENDRIHPEKRTRPIASGAVTVPAAIILMILLALASFAGAWFINTGLLYVLLVYAGVNLGYSLGLKRIALLDIVLVSSGFILRVLAGGLIAGVAVSQWLFIMTFLFALFLSIAKRRDDLVLLETTGTEMRKSVKGYNMDYINVMMGMMTAVIIVSYLLYITSPEIAHRFPGKKLYVSVLFVIIGLMRYLQITLVEKKSGSPTKVLLKDLFIQLTVIGWVAYFAIVIYFLGNGSK